MDISSSQTLFSKEFWFVSGVKNITTIGSCEWQVTLIARASGVAGSRGSCPVLSVSLLCVPLSALPPRGLQCERSLRLRRGHCKSYLHPVHGDGGPEVSPRKRGCWPRKARKSPPAALPLCLAAVHPRAPLGCVGVPAGHEAALKPPC